MGGLLSIFSTPPAPGSSVVNNNGGIHILGMSGSTAAVLGILACITAIIVAVIWNIRKDRREKKKDGGKWAQDKATELRVRAQDLESKVEEISEKQTALTHWTGPTRVETFQEDRWGHRPWAAAEVEREDQWGELSQRHQRLQGDILWGCVSSMRRLEQTVGRSERRLEAALNTMPSLELCQRVEAKLDQTSDSLALLMSHFKVEEAEPSARDTPKEEDTESVSSAESVRTIVPAKQETPKKKQPMSMSVPAGPGINLQEMVQRRLEEGLAFPPFPSPSPPTSPYIWRRRGAPRVRLDSTGEKN
jgi:hypothetical protein